MKLEPDRVAGVDSNPGDHQPSPWSARSSAAGESVGVPVKTIQGVEQVRTEGTKTVVEPFQGVEHPRVPCLVAVVVARHGIGPG